MGEEGGNGGKRKMTSLPVQVDQAAGHEGTGFVQPSSYLRPRGQSNPMPHAEPESAIERDQRIGLVCVNCLWKLLSQGSRSAALPYLSTRSDR